MEKICTICEKSKPLEDFVPRGKSRRNQCKACVNAAAKISRDKTRAVDPEATRELDWRRNLMRLYHMTPEDWQRMFDSQGGVCYYCEQPETLRHIKGGGVRRLAVDHDHNCCSGYKSCGKCVRHLLCRSCNMLLGTLEVKKDIVLKMNSELHILA